MLGLLTIVGTAVAESPVSYHMQDQRLPQNVQSEELPSHTAVAVSPLSIGQMQGSPQVPLWGLFEASVTNSRSYTNPFTDTELHTRFVSPSGRAYTFFGFYDGDGNGGQQGNIWKLRFMCLQQGTWSWSASFTDGAPGASGSFQCLDSALPGPLQPDPHNPRWLQQPTGAHFLPRWYYLHELLFSQEGTWQQDVDNLLVAKGYNTVTVLTTQAETLKVNGWDYRPYETPYFYPWLKDGTSVRWDTFDLRAWHKLDRVLRYLQDRRIYIYFFDGFFPNIPPRFPDDAAMEQAYLRYALARTGPYWNVTHNVTFEFDEFMSTSRLNRIGRYIHSIDPFHTLLTVHDTQGYDALVQSETWLDLANLQYNAGTAGSASISNPFVLSHYRGKPVSGTELVWEGPDKLNADQVRRGGWGILIGGGFFLYGEFDLDGAGVGPYGAGQAHPYLKVMFDFMEDIPYWTMSPHNELVSSDSYCLADPGREYVVYAEQGGTVRVDLTGASGTLQVRWLNPRTGQYTAGGQVPGGTAHSFTNPAADANDWILHLKDGGQMDRFLPYIDRWKLVVLPSDIAQRAVCEKLCEICKPPKT